MKSLIFLVMVSLFLFASAACEDDGSGDANTVNSTGNVSNTSDVSNTSNVSNTSFGNNVYNEHQCDGLSVTDCESSESCYPKYAYPILDAPGNLGPREYIGCIWREINCSNVVGRGWDTTAEAPVCYELADTCVPSGWIYCDTEYCPAPCLFE